MMTSNDIMGASAWPGIMDTRARCMGQMAIIIIMDNMSSTFQLERK